jgi:hypothetical protein
MIQGFRNAFAPTLFFSRSARNVYKNSAIGTMLFISAFIGLYTLSSFGVIDGADDSVRVTFRCLLFAGALCFGTLCVSMQYYCFRFDKSSLLARTLWFGFMVTGIPFTFLLYFYIVYLPQTKPEQEQALSASNAN